MFAVAKSEYELLNTTESSAIALSVGMELVEPRPFQDACNHLYQFSNPSKVIANFNLPIH